MDLEKLVQQDVHEENYKIRQEENQRAKYMDRCPMCAGRPSQYRQDVSSFHFDLQI